MEDFKTLVKPVLDTRVAIFLQDYFDSAAVTPPDTPENADKPLWLFFHKPKAMKPREFCEACEAMFAHAPKLETIIAANVEGLFKNYNQTTAEKAFKACGWVVNSPSDKSFRRDRAQ